MNRKRISRVATIAALTATAMPLLSTFAKPKEVKAATTKLILLPKQLAKHKKLQKLTAYILQL